MIWEPSHFCQIPFRPGKIRQTVEDSKSKSTQPSLPCIYVQTLQESESIVVCRRLALSLPVVRPLRRPVLLQPRRPPGLPARGLERWPLPPLRTHSPVSVASVASVASAASAALASPPLSVSAVRSSAGNLHHHSEKATSVTHRMDIGN